MSYEVISLQEMDNFLRQRRFYPVDLYFRRRPVKEWVYERRLPQNANHFVRVYTTIQRYGGKTDQSRDVGKDAIRVQVIYRDDKGETLVSMPKRVNRVGTWKDNLDDRMTEIAQTLPTVTMDSRGEPMTLRKKKGSLFWGSRDYPNYKETRRYGAEQEDLSEGLLREDQYNHIDDSESLKYIYDNFVSPFLESSVSSRKGVMFGPDYREQIDNMMATFKYGFLMRGRQNNDVWLMIPIYEDNDVHDISALSVENGILVLQDSLPLSDIFDAVSGTDPFYYYEPLYRSIWKALLDMDYGMAAINYSIIGKSFAAETIQCCECQTTENITTIHAGTYCYDCLPINLGAEDNYNSKLFSSIVKDIWNRFSVMKSSRHREKYLQREINSRIRLNSGYGGQNEEANDRYFQAITISDTDLRYYIDEEWDDGSVEFNKLTQESLKRVADLQNDLRTKYNNPSIKLEVHENTTVDIEGSGVFVVEISMDANTSFDAEDNYDSTYGVKQAKIRRKLKNKIKKQAIMGTKAGQWSARKSQELKRQYEAACSKKGLKPYKGQKTKSQDNLSKWSKQGWKTASGKKSSVTGEPYFPAKAITALKQQNLYAKAKRQKQAATKAGKQNARYSDDIRAVVKQFRAEGQESEAHSILNWITQPLIVATPEPEPMDCVSCNSDEISAGPVEPAGVGTLVRSVDCESCGCRWEETFNYVSHEIEREGVSNLSKWSKQPYGSFASETTDSEIRQWLKVLRDTDPDWEEIDWEKPSDKPDPDWGLEWEAERRIVKGMRKCDICSMPARNGEELCPNCWTEYLSATYANTHWTEHQHQEAIAILNWMSKPADKPKPTELNWSCPHCKSSKVMHDYDNVPIKHTDEIAITRQYSCQDCNGEWVETWLYDSLKKLNGD